MTPRRHLTTRLAEASPAREPPGPRARAATIMLLVGRDVRRLFVVRPAIWLGSLSAMGVIGAKLEDPQPPSRVESACAVEIGRPSPFASTVSSMTPRSAASATPPPKPAISSIRAGHRCRYAMTARVSALGGEPRAAAPELGALYRARRIRPFTFIAAADPSARRRTSKSYAPELLQRGAHFAIEASELDVTSLRPYRRARRRAASSAEQRIHGDPEARYRFLGHGQARWRARRQEDRRHRQWWRSSAASN